MPLPIYRQRTFSTLPAFNQTANLAVAAPAVASTTIAPTTTPLTSTATPAAVLPAVAQPTLPYASPAPAPSSPAPYDDGGGYGGDDGSDDGSGDDGGGDDGSDDDDSSGYDLLGCEEIVGHGGGGGGHGGGGHGGHGGRGRGRDRDGALLYGGWGGGWGWDGDDDDDGISADDFAELVAQKLRNKKTSVGYVAPEEHWYNIATPGDILTEMDNVQREADTLDKDFDAYSGSDPNFPAAKTAWKAFLADYKKFYDDNKGWTSRLWGSTKENTINYGNQLNDWRAKLKSFSGAKVTEPAVTDVQVRVDPTKTNYKPLLIGGLVILGLFGGGYAISKMTGAGSLFKKPTV